MKNEETKITTKLEAVEKIVQKCESYNSCSDCPLYIRSHFTKCALAVMIDSIPVRWRDTEYKESKCCNCVYLKKDDGFPYCMLKNLYDARGLNNNACEDFVEVQNDGRE